MFEKSTIIYSEFLTMFLNWQTTITHLITYKITSVEPCRAQFKSRSNIEYIFNSTSSYGDISMLQHKLMVKIPPEPGLPCDFSATIGMTTVTLLIPGCFRTSLQNKY